MKNLFYLIFFLLIINCSSNEIVYWCGDHPCINKNEKEAYFKKTMTVEIKKINKSDKEKNSEIAQIIQQAKTKEKVRITEEKRLAKQAKLENKRKIKEEKRLAKQEKEIAKKIELDEKKSLKNEKIIKKQSPKKTSKSKNVIDKSIDFKKLAEKIIKENSFRPYPDINDIPN